MLPASVVESWDGIPTSDFAALVAVLAARFLVERIEAPSSARRVADAADVTVLQSLSG